MAPSKLLNLVALATIAVFASSFGVEPVYALSGHGPSNAQHHGLSSRGHDSVAKRKRGMQRRQCQARPQSGSTHNGTNASASASSSSSSSSSASTSVSTSTSASTSTSTSTDTNNSSSNGDNSNNNGGNNNGGSQGNNGGAQSSGGKVCLAWAGGNDPALQNWQTSNSGIIYTWSPWAPQNTYGYTFAPMLWSEKQIDDFKAQVHQGVPYVMGFNEPELEGQATMTPQHGAEVWKQYIQPMAAGGSKLVSPAVTSDPQGKPWLTDFFKACDGCTIDIIALHYYGTSADELINYLTDIHNTFQKPIWLTEYACQNFSGGAQCSPDEIKAFMDKVKHFAETTDWVQQYCWFGATHDMHEVNPNNQLMNSDGKPNALGMDFLGLSQ
ncbi:hypothetical protein V5O48_012175 [Marasmius crinis-equi]|uniref:Asl1-like glycosyl hydrolase catalytic domain-containing protein n=1 Tax=Marasmius crinis-equi TaxID=585013 RepID=A0ABR3F3H8_9AGAR